MSTGPTEAPNAVAGSSIRWVFPAAVLAAIGLGIWFVIELWRAVPPPPLDVGPAATVLRAPIPLPPFALTDHRGQRFDESSLEGRWSFLYFGFTFCPEACPLTLGNFREVHERLAATDGGRDLAGVQFVFVSVDPERDTPERLAAYIPYFHPDFVGVTGEKEALEPLTRALGIYYARAEGGGERDYLVDHTTSVMLIDPHAQLRAIFKDPLDPKEVAEAFSKIRRRGDSG